MGNKNLAALMALAMFGGLTSIDGGKRRTMSKVQKEKSEEEDIESITPCRSKQNQSLFEYKTGYKCYALNHNNADRKHKNWLSKRNIKSEQ